MEMPFKSKQQQKYFHYLNEKGKLPKSVDLHEWDKTTDFKDLPNKVPSRFQKLRKLCMGGKI